jgi:hypothetical protein
MADRVDEQYSSQLPNPPRSDALYLRTTAQQSASQPTDHRNSAWSFHHTLEPDIGYLAEPSYSPHPAALPWPISEGTTTSQPLFHFPLRQTVETFSPLTGVEGEYGDEDAEGSVYDDTDLIGVNPEDVMEEDEGEDAEGEMYDEDMQPFDGDYPSLSVYNNPQEIPFDSLNLSYRSNETIDHNTRPTMERPLNSSARARTPETEVLPYDSDPPMLLFSPLYDYCFSAPALSAASSSSSSSPASFIPHSTHNHLSDSSYLQGATKSDLDPTRLWQPDWDKPWMSQNRCPPHSAVAYGYGVY